MSAMMEATRTGINQLTNLDMFGLGQVAWFFQTMSRLVNRFNILYDFSGHKPDLEGKIQICFRYGFDRPVLSVLWFMIDEFRNHINRWRYYAIHLVEQKGTLIDMFVIFLKYNFKKNSKSCWWSVGGTKCNKNHCIIFSNCFAVTLN